MGIFDSAKDLVDQHADKVDALIEKAGDMVDEKTDGKFEGIVDKAQDALQDQTGNN